MKRRPKNARLKQYDYRTGWFFVTNKTLDNRPILVEKIRGLVRENIDNLNYIDGVNVDTRVIMPTHVHAILEFDDAPKSLTKIWGEFKGRTTHQAKESQLIDYSLWQRGFYEHIIRNEKALDAVRNYILKNAFELNIPWGEIYQAVGIEEN